MTSDEVLDYEDRLEFWDAEAETAWICEDGNTTTHESPGAGLPMLLAWIAGVRGLPIRCLGSTSILLNDPGGRWLRMMQPDQGVYLNPGGLWHPRASQILRSRGIPVSPGFPQSLPNFDRAAVEDLVAAAQGCTSEADFAKRILADRSMRPARR